MKIVSILFDLDGTLIDTAPDLAYALNTLLKQNGLSEKPYAKIKPLVALGGKALVKFGFKIDDTATDFASKHEQILRIYTNNIDKHSTIFKGIDRVINTIKRQNMYWGIVTNKPENLTHLLLEKLSLKPDVIVCGDTLPYNKPHPAPLLYACAQLSILPENCLFVGDDKNDILAGKNAGIKTVAVTWGYGKVDKTWNYDYLISQPQELEKWIL